VLLHPSVIERFAVSAPGLSGPARRTLRTNLRFLARNVVPALAPADAPLPRERAKVPYSPAEIAGYLALADAQPTASRRMRAAGLVCLGAGACLVALFLPSSLVTRHHCVPGFHGLHRRMLGKRGSAFEEPQLAGLGDGLAAGGDAQFPVDRLALGPDGVG